MWKCLAKISEESEFEQKHTAYCSPTSHWFTKGKSSHFEEGSTAIQMIKATLFEVYNYCYLFITQQPPEKTDLQIKLK